MTSILLVDDHAAVSAAMAAAFRADGFGPVDAIEVVGVDGESIVKEVVAAHRDVVLLDIHLDNGRLSHELVAPMVAAGSKVIIMTASASAVLIGAALRNGASAVVEKSASFDEVVDTVRRVAAGERVMSDDERSHYIAAAEEGAESLSNLRAAFESLTPREELVLRGLVAGHSPKEIAAEHHLSVATVRGHIERVLRKLGVSGQLQALAAARSIGWPDADLTPP